VQKFSLKFVTYKPTLSINRECLAKITFNIGYFAVLTRCSAMAERQRCMVRYSFRQK